MRTFDFLVHPSRLQGEIQLSGAKNSVLKLMAATLLTDERVIIDNYPVGLLDAEVHLGMLMKLGKHCVVQERSLWVSNAEELKNRLDWHDRSIRNTLLILGCLVARTGYGAVPLPGGCPLGERKYDLHVKLLEQMGARVYEEGKMLCAESSRPLQGVDIHLPIRSTGATENAILCGTQAQGTTRVWNPHIRPETMDMVGMLRCMGAKITVFGQEHIEIIGTPGELHGVEYRVVPDNMEALTWMIGAAITDGDLLIQDFPMQHLEVPLIHLRESGVNFYRSQDGVIVRGARCYPLDIATGPYPGINSDMQPLFGVFASFARGVSTLVDLRFPGRYGYAEELRKMGADCEIGELLRVTGHGSLHGAEVHARDLRCGAALLLAGLAASDGSTRIRDAWQIERGYDRIVEKLRGCGAQLELIEADHV